MVASGSGNGGGFRENSLKHPDRACRHPLALFPILLLPPLHLDVLLGASAASWTRSSLRTGIILFTVKPGRLSAADYIFKGS